MPVAAPTQLVQALIDYLDAEARIFIGAPYVVLADHYKAGAFRVLAEALVVYFDGAPIIAHHVVDLVAGTDFTALIGGTSRTTTPLSTLPIELTRYRRGFALLRNGVDNMQFVEHTPTQADEWTIDEDGNVVLFGDVTGDPDTYRCRYV